MKRIAIQGTLGSYHDIAAHKYFEGEEIELICCATFEDVFAAVKKDSKTIGMLAIENTIAGSLLHNNELLRQSGTQIIGEYKLRISHSFVCLPDEDWNDLTEVNSHPIALMQCREFLEWLFFSYCFFKIKNPASIQWSGIKYITLVLYSVLKHHCHLTHTNSRSTFWLK